MRVCAGYSQIDQSRNPDRHGASVSHGAFWSFCGDKAERECEESEAEAVDCKEEKVVTLQFNSSKELVQFSGNPIDFLDIFGNFSNRFFIDSSHVE